MACATANPNNIEARKENMARTLDARIDGRYGKKMKIPHKDIHGDPNTARANRNELLVQAMANREKIDNSRQGNLDTETQLLNTI